MVLFTNITSVGTENLGTEMPVASPYDAYPGSYLPLWPPLTALSWNPTWPLIILLGNTYYN